MKLRGGEAKLRGGGEIEGGGGKFLRHRNLLEECASWVQTNRHTPFTALKKQH